MEQSFPGEMRQSLRFQTCCSQAGHPGRAMGKDGQTDKPGWTESRDERISAESTGMNESLPGQHPAVWSIMRVRPAWGDTLTALSPPKPLLVIPPLCPVPLGGDGCLKSLPYCLLHW